MHTRRPRGQPRPPVLKRHSTPSSTHAHLQGGAATRYGLAQSGKAGAECVTQYEVEDEDKDEDEIEMAGFLQYWCVQTQML